MYKVNLNKFEKTHTKLKEQIATLTKQLNEVVYELQYRSIRVPVKIGHHLFKQDDDGEMLTYMVTEIHIWGGHTTYWATNVLDDDDNINLDVTDIGVKFFTTYTEAQKQITPI